MWKPAKTVEIDKAEEKFRFGIWLDFREESGEYIIGTDLGVVKCRGVRRLDEVGSFDLLRVSKLRGSQWQRIPGRQSLRIPTNIGVNGKVTDSNGADDGFVAEEHEYTPSFNASVEMTVLRI